jgi:mRNA-degrading endonuclease toxin of MazEF toxin-antitoxin module
VKRGEIWTMAGGSGYAGKPSPVLIVQDDAFAQRNSVTVCLITTDPTSLQRFDPLQDRPTPGAGAEGSETLRLL